MSKYYRHFKGGIYLFITSATIEKTGEDVVVYQSLQDGRVWVRPASEFFDDPVPEDRENPTGQKYRLQSLDCLAKSFSAVGVTEPRRIF